MSVESGPGVRRTQFGAFPIVERLEGRALLSAAGAGSAVPWVGPVTAHVAAAAQPQVAATRPAAGAANVSRDTPVAADLLLPAGGIDFATITSATVRLYRTSDGAPVAANVNTTGGGDAIVLQPTGLLAANTQYTFEVTTGVKDVSGNSFAAYKSTFTTGATPIPQASAVSFNKVSLPTTAGRSYTAVTKGPDGKLYAATLEGQILRFGIKADGTLGSPQVITTVQNNNGGKRYLVGLTFDPASTATSPILWVSHGQYAAVGAADFTDKISRLTGANLETYQDVVVGLPRSARDHLTNQLAFGPDGAIYFDQGSNSAMGAPDLTWGKRSEHLLTGAILRLDPAAALKRLSDGLGPVNVKTKDAGGSYDPFTAGVPLTIYATGVRNAYDLVWHSNGSLYAPTNGSAAGGNTPAAPGKPGTGITNVRQTEHDWLFRVTKGGYYGHPNPARGEYIFNGGNPSHRPDRAELASYPVGTQPDPRWKAAAYDFGDNYSPDGAIEYKSATFGGALQGTLIVCRYSAGDDLIVLRPNADGSVTRVTGVNGLSGFDDPIDVAEDAANGNLYVAEHGGKEITLLRPSTLAGSGTTDPAVENRLVFGTPAGTAYARQLQFKNTGSSPLVLNAASFAFTGANASLFRLSPNRNTFPKTVPPGATATILIDFAPPAGTAAGVKTAAVGVKTAAGAVLKSVSLRGLPTKGLDGANEPSLQRILDLWEIPVNVGDTNPNDSTLGPVLAAGNQQVKVPQLFKAGPGPVTVQPLAAYTPAGNPAATFGYYAAGTSTLRPVLSTGAGENQTVVIHPVGSTSFDPGSGVFGLYTRFPVNGGRTVWQDDARNTWEPVASSRNKVRFYPLRNKDGSLVANAYVVAFEEIPGTSDVQDFVAVVRNVRPTAAATTPTPVPTPTPTPTTKPVVTALTLINADTDKPIGVLKDGMTLNLSSLPTRRLNVRADVSGTVGSVKFGYDTKATFLVENFAPYALVGDVEGDFNAWTPTPGAHTLTVTPFAGRDLSGVGGVSVVIHFTVV